MRRAPSLAVERAEKAVVRAAMAAAVRHNVSGDVYVSAVRLEQARARAAQGKVEK